MTEQITPHNIHNTIYGVSDILNQHFTDAQLIAAVKTINTQSKMANI